MPIFETENVDDAVWDFLETVSQRAPAHTRNAAASEAVAQPAAPSNPPAQADSSVRHLFVRQQGTTTGAATPPAPFTAAPGVPASHHPPPAANQPGPLAGPSAHNTQHPPAPSSTTHQPQALRPQWQASPHPNQQPTCTSTCPSQQGSARPQVWQPPAGNTHHRQPHQPQHQHTGAPPSQLPAPPYHGLAPPSSSQPYPPGTNQRGTYNTGPAACPPNTQHLANPSHQPQQRGPYQQQGGYTAAPGMPQQAPPPTQQGSFPGTTWQQQQQQRQRQQPPPQQGAPNHGPTPWGPNQTGGSGGDSGGGSGSASASASTSGYMHAPGSSHPNHPGSIHSTYSQPHGTTTYSNHAGSSHHGPHDPQPSGPAPRGNPPQATQPPRTGPLYTATCQLDSMSSCKFTFSGYHMAVVAACRKVPGAVALDSSSRTWRVPLTHYQAALAQLGQAQGVQVRVSELPDIVLAVLKAADKAADDSNLYSKIQVKRSANDQSIEERMMAFQREGVKFGLRRGGRVLIGDEMGLGKTVQACGLLRCYDHVGAALIVVPSSLRDTWANALFSWLRASEDDMVVYYNKQDDAKLARRRYKYLIVSYDWLRKLEKELDEVKWGIVVLDESHYIKNHQSQRSKLSQALVKSIPHALLLTGTPALSRPVELFTQMDSLLPKARLTHKRFIERYCTLDQFNRPKGSQNLDELNKLITGTIMVRRRKADVEVQLPPKRRQQIYLRLEDADMRELAEMAEAMKAVRKLQADAVHMGCARDSMLSGLSQEHTKFLTELYNKTARMKIRAVQSYVKDVLSGSEEKFLVFAHHKELLDGIEKALNQEKVEYIRIDGDTNQRERQGLVDRFQERESVRVAVLGIMAAGVGLTLTAASTVLFAELYWVPGNIMQAEDRVHRIGQTTSVNIHFLLVRNSIDDIMWTMLQSKLENVGQLLDGRTESMQVASARVMPDKNQGALEQFLGPARAADGEGASKQTNHASNASGSGTRNSGNGANTSGSGAKNAGGSGSGSQKRSSSSSQQQRDENQAPPAAGTIRSFFGTKDSSQQPALKKQRS